MSEKLPALQFYPGDWKKDAGVQSLIFHDRHVWFEILMLMHESPRRGVLLLPNGSPMTNPAIARAIGQPLGPLLKSLKNIEDAGVSSREEGTGALVNRRMVRDEHLREVRAAAGKLGGNPYLVKQNPSKGKPPGKGNDNLGPEQNPTPSSSSSTSVVRENSKEQNSLRDEAFETFASTFSKIKAPACYQSRKADFVQLAELRKAQGVPARCRPQNWEAACRNYLSSPLPAFTLADLCVRYSVFVHSPLDRFNRPVETDDTKRKVSVDGYPLYDGPEPSEEELEEARRRDRERTAARVSQQQAGRSP